MKGEWSFQYSFGVCAQELHTRIPFRHTEHIEPRTHHRVNRANLREV